MSDEPAAESATEPALELERVERSHGGEKLLVRVNGRWQGRRGAPEDRAMLVVEVDERRYRFPAIRQPRRARIGRPGAWSATFALPAWLESRPEGRMSLSVGDAIIPLADLSAGTQALDGPAPSRSAASSHGVGHDRYPEPGSGMDIRSQDMIAALRFELQERAAAEARARGRLADAQAELEARTAHQAQLESLHAELRGELDQLRRLVEQEGSARAEVESKALELMEQVAAIQEEVSALTSARDRLARERDRLEREGESLRAELAASAVSREAASSEVAALRSELERLGAELAAAREHSRDRNGGLDEAEALLAEARALTASMRQRP